MSDSFQEQAQRLKTEVSATRAGGRAGGEGRPFGLETGYTMHAEGSVLASAGHTRVICTASLEERVPPHRRGSGGGWLTAEYAMLPRATNSRTQREVNAGKPSGRTAEIQRLVGRSLRAVTDLDVLGERTIWVDCDVIQADGGTRTVAISGGFVALALALRKLAERHTFKRPPLRGWLASVSVGLVDGVPLLDLDYAEDARAEVDLNVVMTDALDIVEIQGAAEGEPFARDHLQRMLDLAETGVQARIAAQREALGDRLV